jgi:hypothetical protein
VPIGTIALVLVYVAMPNSFPDLGDSIRGPRQISINISELIAPLLRRSSYIFDWIAALLLLIMSAFLLLAVEEVGSTGAGWQSPIVLISIFMALLSLTNLLWHEARQSRLFKLRKTKIEPLFMGKLLLDRTIGCIMLYVTHVLCPTVNMSLNCVCD